MEHENEKLDTMLERLMRDEGLESPSFDFTNKVMDKVFALEVNSTLVYKPLISKKAWFLMGLTFLAIIIYVLLNGSGEGSEWLSRINLSNYQFNLFKNFNFELSKTLSYGIVLFAVMIGVQVTLLKSYFDKRISI